MSNVISNATDSRRAKIDRVIAAVTAMNDADLDHMESTVAMLRVAPHPSSAPLPQPRIVAGATITDRPDLIAAAGGALVQTAAVGVAPPSDAAVPPAELAKIGGATR